MNSIVALLGLLLTASAGRLDLDKARRQLATLDASCAEAKAGVVARNAEEIQSAIENHTSVCIHVVGSVGIPADDVEIHVPEEKEVMLYSSPGGPPLLRLGESAILVNEGRVVLWGLSFQTRGKDKVVSLPCRHATLLLRG